MVILESLRKIVQGSLDTRGIRNRRIFVTERSNIRSEVERKLDRDATFVLIEPTGDGIFRYLHKTLKNDPIPEMMNSIMKANIIEATPEISSETYAEPRDKKKKKVRNRRTQQEKQVQRPSAWSNYSSFYGSAFKIY